MLTREKIKETLNNQDVLIEFEKADGSIRTMTATLRHEVLPPVQETNRKKNPDVQVVWDVQAGNWRSFRWDRLKSFGVEQIPNDI